MRSSLGTLLRSVSLCESAQLRCVQAAAGALSNTAMLAVPLRIDHPNWLCRAMVVNLKLMDHVKQAVLMRKGGKTTIPRVFT